MPDIVPPMAQNPIVDDKGSMSAEFQRWVTLINGNDFLVGSGNPEGAVKADQYKIYFDESGTAGNIMYFKRDPDDGAGDKTKGWILV